MDRSLLIAGQLLRPAAPRTLTHAWGWLEVHAGRIVRVASGDPPRTPDLGDESTFISPGFIDTHLHIPQFDSIGITGLELLDWLDRVIFPAEARWSDADYAGQMATRVAKQLISVGTTAIAAYGTVHHAGTQNALAALAHAGIRGVVGQTLMDRNAPPELLRPCAQLLAEAARLAPVGRIAPAITPRFAISCTDELLRGAGQLARATGWFVQTHLAETPRELATIREIYGPTPYTRVYHEAGLLTPRCLLGHGIWLDRADHDLLRASGSTIAHCPTANRFLHAGQMHRARALSHGVAVSLGSDVAGGPDRSMVRVARAMAETARGVDQPFGSGPSPDSQPATLSAAECWWQITAGNAQALQLPDAGTLAPNFAADFVLFRPDIAWQSSIDPLSTLLYAWDDRWITGTMLAGVLHPR